MTFFELNFLVLWSYLESKGKAFEAVEVPHLKTISYRENFTQVKYLFTADGEYISHSVKDC